MEPIISIFSWQSIIVVLIYQITLISPILAIRLSLKNTERPSEGIFYGALSVFISVFLFSIIPTIIFSDLYKSLALIDTMTSGSGPESWHYDAIWENADVDTVLKQGILYKIGFISTQVSCGGALGYFIFLYFSRKDLKNIVSLFGVFIYFLFICYFPWINDIYLYMGYFFEKSANGIIGLWRIERYFDPVTWGFNPGLSSFLKVLSVISSLTFFGICFNKARRDSQQYINSGSDV